jgi:hypothetical protein
MTARRILVGLLPPVVLEAARAMRRRQSGHAQAASAFTPEEFRAIVARMDAGDFAFDAALEEHLCAAWRIDPASVPYPSVLTKAYATGDAVAMNDKSLMEVSYRLPYSHAYESTQRHKYEEFLRAVARAGVDFSGAVAITDVGCGYGGLLTIAREMYPAAALCGVECAHSAVEFMAQRRSYIRGAYADVEAEGTAFAGAVGRSHDIVLCTEVLEHLMRPELALANLMSLRPSRAIALTVPQGRVDTAAQHINFWSQESWRAFIERNANGWRTVCGLCPSPGSPGGADNFAVLLPH